MILNNNDNNNKIIEVLKINLPKTTEKSLVEKKKTKTKTRKEKIVDQFKKMNLNQTSFKWFMSRHLPNFFFFLLLLLFQLNNKST